MPEPAPQHASQPDREARNKFREFQSFLTATNRVPAQCVLANLEQQRAGMCLNFADICRKYSLGQVNQAIWMIIGAEFDLLKHLWDNSVALNHQIECIRSIYFVYSDFVVKSDVDIMENCFDIWWDMLATSFWFQTDFFESSGPPKWQFSRRVDNGEVSKVDGNSRALLDAMFETLDRTLELPDHRVRSVSRFMVWASCSILAYTT